MTHGLVAQQTVRGSLSHICR